MNEILFTPNCLQKLSAEEISNRGFGKANCIFQNRVASAEHYFSLHVNYSNKVCISYNMHVFLLVENKESNIHLQ